MELEYQDGLIPAIIQDARSGKVLMLGYMNGAAYEKTLETGYVTFYSRSRRKLWVQGEQSGHRLAAREVIVDCDQDTLLIKAELGGPGCCHEGYETCFYRKITPQGSENVEPQAFNPEDVYKK